MLVAVEFCWVVVEVEKGRQFGWSLQYSYWVLLNCDQEEKDCLMEQGDREVGKK